MKRFFFTILFSISFFPVFSLAATIVDGNLISEDTVWTKNESPYVLNDMLFVESGVTLTLEPGTILKFGNRGMIVVYGGLISNGNSNERIYFTTSSDDSLGGDTDNNGETTVSDCNLQSLNNLSSVSFDFSDKKPEISYVTIRGMRSPLEFFDTDVILNDIVIEKSCEGVSAYDGSVVSLNNFNTSHIDSSAVSAYNNSSISVTNSSMVDTSRNEVISIYNSTLSFDNVLVKGIKGMFSMAIDLYGSTAKIVNSEIIDGEHNGIGLFKDWENEIQSSLELSKTKISNFSSYGIYVSESSFTATNSEISGSNIGISADLSSVNVSQSAIKNNSYGIEQYDSVDVNVANNFWGDISGPYNETTNPSGLGNSVSDGVIFSPWLDYDPTVKPDPVIIVPGILGSIISKNYGEKEEVWPNISTLLTSFSDDFLNELALKSDGTEDAEKPMLANDILRSVFTEHMFDGLISEFTNNGYVEGKDLFVFPYDWRKSSVENALLLKNKIDEIAVNSENGKVDIVAHSMGGLVSKKYIYDNGADKIDQLVFIGTPHLGAPKAFKALMYGDDMGIRFGFSILNPNTLKTITQNMPSVFELLPSKKYVDEKGYKYVTDTITQYISSSTSSPKLGYEETEKFMIDQGRNPQMFYFADNLHDNTDNLDLSGVKIYDFVGCANPTIGKITAKKKKAKISSVTQISDDFKIGYVNGDGTVPFISAEDVSGKKYYVKNAVHSLMPSTDGVKQTIISIFKNKTPDSFSNILSDTSNCNISGDIVSSHSPVAIHIYDEAGNHTGPNENGDIEYGISGVQYDEIGGDTFAFLPDGGNYRVVIKAKDSGAYDFYVEHSDFNGVEVSSYYWNEIPLESAKTSSEISINPVSSVGGMYEIRMDSDGNGIFEENLSPSAILNATSSVDIIPPETQSDVSDGEVSFLATDDNSGVLKTEYSFNGSKWSLYEKPIEASGETVKYFSTDKAGNIETIKEISVPEKKQQEKTSGGGGGGPIFAVYAFQQLKNSQEENLKEEKLPEIISTSTQIIPVVLTDNAKNNVEPKQETNKINKVSYVYKNKEKTTKIENSKKSLSASLIESQKKPETILWTILSSDIFLGLFFGIKLLMGVK